MFDCCVFVYIRVVFIDVIIKMYYGIQVFFFSNLGIGIEVVKFIVIVVDYCKM